MKSVRNKNGFTLIELIAVIVIISILSLTAIFTFGKIRESSKNKADELTYNSIMKSAASYANEYYNEEKYWLHVEKEDIETFCVPVLELYNKGYLKQDNINNVSYNFVLLTRDYINKTLIKEEYDKEGICGGSTDRGKGVLQLISKTTTSITVATSCNSTGLVNYTYGLFDSSNNEIKNYTTKDNTHKFGGLISDKEYNLKVKCNYQDYNNTDYGEDFKQKTGYTNLDFAPKNIATDTTKNRAYKEIDINYTSKNIHKKEAAIYYFKVTSEENISNINVFECGNDKTPSLSCSNNTTELKKGYWYKTASNNIKLKIYNNATIYTKIWDGESFSTNKTLQVTLPTNPYVNINIEHELFDDYNGQYIGEENNIIEYHTDSWMSMPKISWTIYGGYETESTVYYSNSGNDDDDYINRRNANISSGYKCNNNSCTFDKDKIGNNGGMQEIKIVVTNKITYKSTIIYIKVNIDKKAPIFNISNSSKGKWTNQNIILDFDYSDAHSGININKFMWKDNVTHTSYRLYKETNKYQDKWGIEGSRIATYKICDNADNCTEVETIIQIDKTDPKLTIDNPIEDKWTNKDITVKLKYSDAASGINKNSLEWSTDENKWTFISNASTSNCTNTWDDNRNSKVYYRICDKVGNCATKETTIKIDATPPEIPEIYNPYANKWSKGNFSLTLSSRDNLSGIAYYQYTYNANASTAGTNHNTTWVTYNNSDKEIFDTIPFTAQRNQPVYVRACDYAGNCSNRKSTQIKIDTTPPTITLKNYSGGDWTYGSVKVLIKFSDDMSGINAKSLKWHDNAKQTEWKLIDNENTSSREETWSSPGDRIGTYQICDNVGNCNEASTSIKIMEYKEMPKKTNGSWWIWNVPGYVGSQTSCKSYMRWIGDGNSPYVTVDSNKCVVNNKEGSDFATAHLVGVVNDNYTVYIKVRDGKMVETSGSNSNSNLFIKIYIQKEAINGSSSVAYSKCYDGSNIENCNLDTIKINNTTYYGVWIKDTCKQDGKTCPPNGISLIE